MSHGSGRQNKETNIHRLRDPERAEEGEQVFGSVSIFSQLRIQKGHDDQDIWFPRNP